MKVFLDSHVKFQKMDYPLLAGESKNRSEKRNSLI